MHARYTKGERALRRESLKQLKVADNEIARGKLRKSLQELREAALRRAKDHIADRAQKAADAIAPKRTDFAREHEFLQAVELHYLRLDEAACRRALNSAKTSLRDRALARRRLKEITLRGLRLNAATKPKVLQPQCPELRAPTPECGTLGAAEPLLDVTKLSDENLRNDVAREKWSRDALGRNNAKLIAALEDEIGRRRLSK